MRGPTIFVGALLIGLGVALAAGSPLTLPPELPAADRTKLEGIVRSSFASTRVEQPPYVARAEIWEFLLDHPEFASHVTRALKVARYRIWHEGGELWLDDGWGVRGQFRFVHVERGRRILYARGRFEQTLLPTIHGQGVGSLEYAFRPTGDQRATVATAVSGYLQVDNRALNALGRLAAPFVQAKADREAGLLLRTFARVMRAIEEDPASVYRRVAERADAPRAELERFRQLLRVP